MCDLKKIQDISYTSHKELLEAERRRLIILMKTEIGWWESGNSDWARKQFGLTLTEKVGDIYPNGDPYDEGQCHICGSNPQIDEIFCKLTFSFCSEYTCGMNICLLCAKDIIKKIKAKGEVRK